MDQLLSILGALCSKGCKAVTTVCSFLTCVSPPVVQVRSCVCWATTRMENGVKFAPRTDKAGCPPTTSRRSTVWRSTAGTTGLCLAALQSTCSPPSSMGASWSGKVRAAPVSCPYLCAMRGESTTTGSTPLLMERYKHTRFTWSVNWLIEGFVLYSYDCHHCFVISLQ